VPQLVAGRPVQADAAASVVEDLIEPSLDNG